MSFFLNPYGSQNISQERLNIAEVQFDAMCTSFNTMLYSCLEKCIPHDEYGEGDLNKGETCCIDRCISKIHYSNRLMGGYLQTRGVSPETILNYYELYKKSDAE